ncbi:unnamed protein product [Darwinula stevensoni]|uniref:Transmembrane protein 135 N-terminal domain-containing protein n=1 Tax=Darwinula stevensoni TaxID=69355 RepID=A0A7R8X138_9CRUS|nr:unnamed protein product [Darwinula stevensoni]CAG0879796.1 unnamed protein product [Darwinula stevensoni]
MALFSAQTSWDSSNHYEILVWRHSQCDENREIHQKLSPLSECHQSMQHGVLKPFVLGVGVQAMLQLVSSWKRIVYKRDFQAFFAKKNLRLPLFLLALSSSYRCMYGLGMEKGFVRSVPGFTVFLYATSTALLLHAAVVEPHNLKDSYWRFLNRITGNRISEMNRRLLDEFGFRSSTLQPSFWPQYDMTQVSPHLKEFMQKNAIPS